MTRGRRLKILTDFDGVWTAVDGQARAVDQARGRRLAELSGLTPGEVARCEETVAAAMAARPLDFGWRIDGRISAYADEDPFLRHNALVGGINLLAGRGEPACLRLAAALAAAGHTDLGALGSAIFLAASREFLDRDGHDLLPEAPAVLQALLQVADVVFCTNFTPGAVAGSWQRRGFAFAGTEATPGLTLRGEARKQQLTGDPVAGQEFGGRPVAVDRAHYRAILAAERPDLVVGDVFSLYLALPLVMAREAETGWSPLCVLMSTAHTPGWSRELAKDIRWPLLRTLASLEQLPTLALELAARRPQEGRP